MSQEARKIREPSPVRPDVAVAVVVAVFLAAALPLIVSGYNGGRGAFDAMRYHLPAVEAVARLWPRPDFLHFSSATTPGYHVALALLRRYLGAGPRALRLAGATFTVGWLATQAADAGRRIQPMVAVSLCLPLVCSPYVFESGAWVLPDNAAWWGVLSVMLLSLRPRIDGWFYLGGGATLLAVALVRQLDIWCAAPLLAAAWVGPGGSGPAASRAGAGRAGRGRRVALAAVAVAPAFLAVGWFLHLWQGAVPPAFREFNAGGANLAVPAMVLSVFGLLSAFYAGFLAPSSGKIRRGWPVLAGAALTGLLAGALPRTSYDMNAGRWSGIWNLARHLPTVAHRSPLLIAGSALGGVMLTAWAMALPRRARWVFLAAWAAFLAANTASHEAFQRYCEPFALSMLAICAGRIAETNHADSPAGLRLRPAACAVAGPVALAALLSVITALGICP